MHFDLTDERRMLQDGLRRYLMVNATPGRLSEASESACGHDEALWAGLAELGVLGALFTKEDGGYGGGGFDIALVFEEMGRAGAFEPLLESCVLAGGLIAELGDAAQKSLVEGIVAGERRLAFAHTEPLARYDLSDVRTRANRVGDGYAISGDKAVVLAAPAADALVVSARTGGGDADESGVALFLVPKDAPGLSIRDYPLTGGGRAAELRFDETPLARDALLGPEGGAFAALEKAAARATLAVSAEALGLMETIRALTTDFLRTRKQFGQPLGNFQALRHRMADMLIEIEQARSAVINLAGRLDADRLERERHVSATKNLIGRAARLVSEESVQMHGAIGMTEEYALGHLVRRLTMVDHKFGDADHHLERFIRLSEG